jgi:hypothetical protein
VEGEGQRVSDNTRIKCSPRRGGGEEELLLLCIYSSSVYTHVDDVFDEPQRVGRLNVTVGLSEKEGVT